jgi:hypothetical protein
MSRAKQISEEKFADNISPPEILPRAAQNPAPRRPKSRAAPPEIPRPPKKQPRETPGL